MNHLQLSSVHRWFLENLWPLSPASDVATRTAWTRNQLTDPSMGPVLRDRLAELLVAADLGVTGITVDPDGGEVQLTHRSTDGNSRGLDFLAQESLGTQAWFAFLGPLLHVLDEGGVLLVDELDSSIHPTLAAEVIRLFQDRQANPRPAQLVFTTQDATLLGPSVAERPLDRDQVWIALKGDAGDSMLYPLTAARKARKDENLERRYLHGHYGGIPRITTGAIARQIALLEEGTRATA